VAAIPPVASQTIRIAARQAEMERKLNKPPRISSHPIRERCKRTSAANCDAMADETFVIFSFSWIRILDDGTALFEGMYFLTVRILRSA
jgi:hypothetical protein